MSCYSINNQIIEEPVTSNITVQWKFNSSNNPVLYSNQQVQIVDSSPPHFGKKVTSLQNRSTPGALLLNIPILRNTQYKFSAIGYSMVKQNAFLIVIGSQSRRRLSPNYVLLPFSSNHPCSGRKSITFNSGPDDTSKDIGVCFTCPCFNDVFVLSSLTLYIPTAETEAVDIDTTYGAANCCPTTTTTTTTNTNTNTSNSSDCTSCDNQEENESEEICEGSLKTIEITELITQNPDITMSGDYDNVGHSQTYGAGYGAMFSLTSSNGIIEKVTVSKGGCGYLSGDTITFSNALLQNLTSGSVTGDLVLTLTDEFININSESQILSNNSNITSSDSLELNLFPDENNSTENIDILYSEQENNEIFKWSFDSDKSLDIYNNAVIQKTNDNYITVSNHDTNKTSGIIQLINVEKNTNFSLNVKGYSSIANNFLIASDKNGNTLLDINYQETNLPYLQDEISITFNSKENIQIYVGVAFKKNSEIGDTFHVSEINVCKLKRNFNISNAIKFTPFPQSTNAVQEFSYNDSSPENNQPVVFCDASPSSNTDNPLPTITNIPLHLKNIETDIFLLVDKINNMNIDLSATEQKLMNKIYQTKKSD